MVMEADGRGELSGQGGWNPETLDFPGTSIPVEDEIAQAFDNVAFMLRATAEMARQFRLRMPVNRPIWTCLGVAVLGDPAMRVEIRVTAFRD